MALPILAFKTDKTSVSEATKSFWDFQVQKLKWTDSFWIAESFGGFPRSKSKEIPVTYFATTFFENKRTRIYHSLSVNKVYHLNMKKKNRKRADILTFSQSSFQTTVESNYATAIATLKISRQFLNQLNDK